QVIEGWEELARREVACSPKDHHHARARLRRSLASDSFQFLQLFFKLWHFLLRSGAFLPCFCGARLQLDVSTEFLADRGKQFFRERMFLAGAETRKQSR